MDGTTPRTARRLVHAALAVFGASTLFVLVLGVGGGDLFDALDDILPFSFAAAALLALAGWEYERRAAAGGVATKQQEQRESQERVGELERALSHSEAERHKLESRLRDRQEALRHEQHTRLRVERARQAEREWARELREQVLALHRRQGAMGDADDIRELVLRIAIELVGAEKGLLLSREDRDQDGRLDLITHRGFEHDPADSDVAQRFAERVLERDEIVREDQPGASNSLADEEIQCLVAVPVYINDDFEGAVVCANRPGGFEELDNDVLLALGDHAGAVLENTRLHVQLRSTYLAVIGMLSDSIATKDPFGATYSRQISGYVEAVAKRLGLEAPEREQLLFAALLRDIGKLGISERVLLKPGPLSREEWDVVRLHPQIGCRIVERVPGLNRLGAAIRHHQERWDGSGYPSQLAQAEIPLAARIVAVAAAFSAMVEGRPYRPSLSVEAACREIMRCAGTQFDPEVAELFVEEIRRRPLHDSDAQPVAEALDDPGVRARRHHDEPLLGHGPVGATDNVTLLYSHRYLLEFAEFEAERARRHARPFAVVMVEVCDLPEINRRDGYAAGDAALFGVARALEEAIATTPAILGRYSGRRVAAIVPKGGQTVGTAVADELLGRLADGGPVVRAAVAVWQHGDHGEAVLSRARLGLERGAAVALRR
jgi:HD-GYP domain-containing protein (c-di-GMP phosphodiesterase class II)/GGDEF domain-containing protein